MKPFVSGEGTVGFAVAVPAHTLIQRGEEEVLQDGLVVGGAGFALRVEALEYFGEIRWMEELLGNEALFLEKPAEDEAGEEADEASGAPFFVVGLEVGGKLDLRERPKIPVGQLAVEAFVEQFDVKDLLPCGMEGVEVGDGELLRMDKI